MSDFKTLKGLFIKHVSSDPSNLIEGQIWYNSTTQVLKVAPQITSWASGGDMNNTGYSGSAASAATQNAQVVAATFNTTNVEEYDGSSWTAVTAIPEKMDQAAGAGTQTAGLFFGGQIPSADAGGPAPAAQSECFEYDGTDWTAGGDLGTERYGLGGCGTQTAGLASGGRTISPSNDPGTQQALTEEYNGTSWTESGDHNANVHFDTQSMFGTQTAAVHVGGRPIGSGTAETNVEEYNGTSWTAGEAFPAGRRGANAAGVLTSGIVFGGGTTPSAPNNTTATFTYDGTDFAASAALATARTLGAGGGSTVANALLAGGSTGTAVNNTEEFLQAATARTVDTT